jgi:hypothetical protein
VWGGGWGVTRGRVFAVSAVWSCCQAWALLSPSAASHAAAVPPPPPSLSGRIGPEYASLELNIGGSVVSAAVCDVCGVSKAQLRVMYKQHGDLGDVAQVS